MAYADRQSPTSNNIILVNPAYSKFNHNLFGQRLITTLPTPKRRIIMEMRKRETTLAFCGISTGESEIADGNEGTITYDKGHNWTRKMAGILAFLTVMKFYSETEN